jgi:hypothetical protein
MRLFEILAEMPAMNRSEVGMGLSQYENDNFIMWGGMRSGSSPAGQTRLKFLIFSMELLKQGVPQEDAEVGFVELFVEDETNEIVGLVNIEIKPKFRKGGYGRKIIQDIKDTTKAGFTVNDIQKKAKRFWDKMGVEYTDKAKRFGKINK